MIRRNAIQYYLYDGYCQTVPYGWRIHPVLKDRRFHYGVDLACKPRNYPLRTPFAGIVQGSSYNSAFGNWITVKSFRTGHILLFGHMQERLVKEGHVLSAGEVIGLLGTTGLSTGVHLHLEIRFDNGTPYGGKSWGDPKDYWEEINIKGVVVLKNHIVIAGETLARVATKYDKDWRELAEINNLQDPYTIYPGQLLIIEQTMEEEQVIPSILREPYTYEINGIAWMENEGLIMADIHKPAEVATKGFVGQMLKRFYAKFSKDPVVSESVIRAVLAGKRFSIKIEE